MKRKTKTICSNISSGFHDSLVSEVRTRHNSAPLSGEHIVTQESLLDLIESNRAVANDSNNSAYFVCRVIGGMFIGVFGIGVSVFAAAATMPIFQEEVEHLERYKINIRDSSSLKDSCLLNTLTVITAHCGLSLVKKSYDLYKYYTNHGANSIDTEEDIDIPIQKNYKTLRIIAPLLISPISSLMPVYLLWKVELDNQQVAKSHGFDEFMKWATATTVPLIIYRSAHSHGSASKFVNKVIDKLTGTRTQEVSAELETIGAKLVVYGTTATAFAGRAITFYSMIKNIMDNILPDDELEVSKKILSVVLGSGMINAVHFISDYSKMKELFTTKFNTSEICSVSGVAKAFLAIFSSLEGAWFALPIVGIGIKPIEDIGIGTLPKAALLVSMYISHANHESIAFYKGFMEGAVTIKEILGDYCCTDKNIGLMNEADQDMNVDCNGIGSNLDSDFI